MIFRPAVSYAQGMTYLAGMLMLHMDEEDAFVCLCNLMDNHLLASLFKMDLVEVLLSVILTQAAKTFEDFRFVVRRKSSLPLRSL